MTNNPTYWCCPYCGEQFLYSGGGIDDDEWVYGCVCGALLTLQPPPDDPYDKYDDGDFPHDSEKDEAIPDD